MLPTFFWVILMLVILSKKSHMIIMLLIDLIRLQDYCWEYPSAIRSLTAARHIHLDDVTHFEKVHGYTPNISEYLIHSWFDWVWYHNPTSPNKVELGR